VSGVEESAGLVENKGLGRGGEVGPEAWDNAIVAPGVAAVLDLEDRPMASGEGLDGVRLENILDVSRAIGLYINVGVTVARQ